MRILFLSLIVALVGVANGLEFFDFLNYGKAKKTGKFLLLVPDSPFVTDPNQPSVLTV